MSEKEQCDDCDECARAANSDATTPGFFYRKCEKHRTVPVATEAEQKCKADSVHAAQNPSTLPSESERQFTSVDGILIHRAEFLALGVCMSTMRGLEKRGYVKESHSGIWRATEEGRRAAIQATATASAQQPSPNR